MDTQEILQRAGAYIEAHGLPDQSDENRRMSRVRHLTDLTGSEG